MAKKKTDSPSSEVPLENRREEFRVLDEYLAAHGLKKSRQREIVLEHFLNTGGHMTVDDLYRVIRGKKPGIGRTTIYRALKLFCAAQIADSIELKDGLTRFEHRWIHPGIGGFRIGIQGAKGTDTGIAGLGWRSLGQIRGRSF